METNVKGVSQELRSMINESSHNYQHVLEQTHIQALEQNETQTKRLEGYRKEHEELKERLLSLRDKLSHEIMVPLGKKALMKGSLVHTNEIMVCLGDGWFAKRTASQAAEICQRRIQNCDEVLKKLQKEKDLLTSRKSFPFDNEAFGSSHTQEVIEAYDEEEEKKWRERHRQKEKEHRQKLAELRKVQNTTIETEEDLWKRLDALDLQEELEDEINRMDEDDDNSDKDDDEEEEEEGEEDSDDSEEESDKDNLESSTTKNDYPKKCEQTVENKTSVLKRRVSFKEESVNVESEQIKEDCVDGDVIRIEFKHSDNPTLSRNKPESEIVSPSDIYLHYAREKMPKSILKPSPSVETFVPDAFVPVPSNVTGPAMTMSNVQPTEPVVKAVGEEVVERTCTIQTTLNEKRPVSKFKASRMAQKR